MRRLAALLLCPLLVAGLLAGCGGSDSGGDEGLPTVTGDYGAKPKVKAQKGQKPGKKLDSTVLKEGDGPAVEKGDLLVADYLGQVYATNKVFDNSYDRGQPAAFPIGTGQVIKGWDKTLVGVKAGSRVLMVVPPADGYGKQGNPQAGIKGTDSLVFVVDVIASYSGDDARDAAHDTNAKPVTGLPKGLPKVTGALGARPKISVPPGATPPKATKATVLAEGDGPEIAKGRLAIVEYEVVSWAGKPLESTWAKGLPSGVPVGAQQPGPFDQLEGVPVGSRVLLLLPAQQGADPAKQSIAVAIDVIAQHGPAKGSA